MVLERIWKGHRDRFFTSSEKRNCGSIEEESRVKRRDDYAGTTQELTGGRATPKGTRAPKTVRADQVSRVAGTRGKIKKIARGSVGDK